MSTIVAQFLDAGGLPLQDIPVLFSTTGGLLGTVDNICLFGSGGFGCTRTGEACSDLNPCPEVNLPPVTVLSDINGVALDTLVLRLIEDPDSVTVTVTVEGTNISATTTVTKTVNPGH